MATFGNDHASANQDGMRAGACMQAELQARRCAHDADRAPRVVTTGGTNDHEEAAAVVKVPLGIDVDTGEPIEIKASHRSVTVTRHLTPDEAASPGVAQTDALAFTVVPPSDQSMAWLVAEMRQFLPVDDPEARGGCFGFKQSVRFGDGAGIVAWGGKSQRGRVYFSIQGKGCALVSDWHSLVAWLTAHHATLKRVDVAYDDFAGEPVNLAWAIDQYRSGGFTFGGRTPAHVCHGDWLLGERSSGGRTLGIGKRANGKHCRIYEKGKQLGDAASPWTRLEVEWRAKDRLIPLDILLRPGAYLAGAYPCLSGLNVEQSRIKTIANASTIDFDAAVANGKQQAGKLVNLMLRVFGGDIGAVIDRLKRDGIPGRIEPYSYQLADCPELLDPDVPGSFAAIAKEQQQHP